MKGKFIYVFDKAARDKLSSIGFKMLKTDEKNSIYIFENSTKLVFANFSFEYALSNTLTF